MRVVTRLAALDSLETPAGLPAAPSCPRQLFTEAVSRPALGSEPRARVVVVEFSMGEVIEVMKLSQMSSAAATVGGVEHA